MFDQPMPQPEFQPVPQPTAGPTPIPLRPGPAAATGGAAGRGWRPPFGGARVVPLRRGGGMGGGSGQGQRGGSSGPALAVLPRAGGEGRSALMARVAALRRPRLLMQAARHALTLHRPGRDLARVAGPGLTPGSTAALATLIEIEEEMEALRHAGTGAYAPARHIAELAALLAEARPAPAA